MPHSGTRTPNETEKKPLSTGFKGVSSEPVLKIQVLSSPRPTKSEILRSAIWPLTGSAYVIMKRVQI